jgi:5-formyltetrahydrofolate cyclo-ligase
LADRDGRPVTVAVAFDVQVVQVVPARDWDVPMQVVVTESTVIRTAD